MSAVLLAAAQVDRESLALFVNACRARSVSTVTFTTWTEDAGNGNTYKVALAALDNAWQLSLPSVGTDFVVGRVSCDVAVIAQALDCIPVSDTSVDIGFAQDGDAFAVRAAGAVADTTIYSMGIRDLR